MGQSMTSTDVQSSSPAGRLLAQKLIAVTPALAALAYPFLLMGFHAALAISSPVGGLFASACLIGAFAAPALGLAFALRSSGLAHPSRFQLRARHLAYLSVAAPPLFVFIAFLRSILGRPMSEIWMWTILWTGAALWVLAERSPLEPRFAPPPSAKLRVVHGAVAALLVVYIFFHLANHLFGLIGPEAHAAVMKLGRGVYRSRVVEPLLVSFLLFQVAAGGWLAWRWSLRRIDRYRVFQIASGVYLWFFILTHLNSALVSARAMRNTETGWAWASGGSAGLIQDAWNIRLVPHYALGVFLILAHLASGLRGVAIAHGLGPAAANRIWAAGLLASAAVTTAIMAGLLGLRL